MPNTPNTPNTPNPPHATPPADDWIIECPSCGHSAPAIERGIIRVRAASTGKRTLARCTACNRLTLARIRKPTPQSQPHA